MHDQLQRRLDEIGAPADVRAWVNELLEQSIRDPLTGLYNRRFFDLTMDQQTELTRRYGRDLTLVLFDLDGFKQVNDTYGHAAGDDVLKRFSQVLKQTVRKSDWVCRMGGDEFAVILPETTELNARTMVERLFQAWKALDVETGEIGVSIGIASLPSDSLFDQADRMLLQAKRMKTKNSEK